MKAALVFLACLLVLMGAGPTAQEPASPGTLFLYVEGDAGGVAVAAARSRPLPWQAPRSEGQAEAWVELRARGGALLERVQLDWSGFNLGLGPERGKILVEGDQVRDPLVRAVVKVPDLAHRLETLRFFVRRAGGADLLGSASGAEIDRLARGVVDPLFAPEVRTHLQGGPSQNRYDIVIIGDGYQAHEQNRFYTDLDGWVNDLFGREPFRSYKAFFNVHSVFRASVESGADHPDANPPIYRDTVYDATYNYGGTPRLLYIRNTSGAMQDALMAPDMEGRVVVFVNDSRYGGGGGQFAVSYNGSQAKEVQCHEFGHSFGGLADEYDYGRTGTYSGPEPSQANITADPTGQVKWPLWIGFNGVGLFEGAGYYKLGLYRPKLNCLMRSLGAPLCEVCVEQLVKRCYGATSPIDAPVPGGTDFRLTASFSIPASFTDLVPGGARIAWYVDNQLRQSGGTSFLLDQARLGTGSFRLRLELQDGSAMVRKDPTRLLHASREWRVESVPVEAHARLYGYSGRPADRLGCALGAADADGDGFCDLLLGLEGPGAVAIYSGATGRLLRTLQVPAGPGLSLAGAGDLNGDGAGEILIGTPADGPAGSARVLSGRDGALLFALPGQAAGEEAGAAVASIGDVDGDKLLDLAVGAPGRGAVRLHAGKDGRLLRELLVPIAGSRFGAALAGIGDVDGDQIPDLLVGAPEAGGAGAAYLLSGKNGQVLRTFPGSVSGGRFGASVAGLGDLDGDGVPDLAVGAPGAGGKGMVSLFSGRQGTLLDRLEGSNTGDRFGTAVAGAGDADGDKLPDILVGAPGESGRGAARLYSGRERRLLALVEGADPGAEFGSAVAYLGDANGDGQPDLLAGGPGAGGAALAFTLARSLQGSPAVVSAVAGGTQQLVLVPGRAHVGKVYVLLGSLGPVRPGIPIGALGFPLAIDPYFDLTAMLANTAVFVDTFGRIPSHGFALASIRVPAGLPPVLAGTQLFHAYLALGAQGTFDFASNAEPLLLR